MNNDLFRVACIQNRAGPDMEDNLDAIEGLVGAAHWHVLVRARAIETGSYVFAPCQWGRHGEGESYGHSLIVDPWGTVVADAGEGVGVIVADIDPGRAAEARAMIPALRHDAPYRLAP